MESRKTDEDTVLAYVSGDTEAFKTLVDKYSLPLYNFAARFAWTEDASDIVQNTFIKAWRNIGRFDPKKASFRTWIFTIARNTALDFVRKKNPILFSELDEPEEDFASSIPGDTESLPDKILEKLENVELLRDLLLKLRPAYREILLLHYNEDMTFEEIGAVLGKSLNTVKSQHRRALIELRRLTEEIAPN